MTRATGKRLLRIGLPAWLLVFVALVAARVAGHGSWSVALLPLFGVPAVPILWVGLHLAVIVVCTALLLLVKVLEVLGAIFRAVVR